MIRMKFEIQELLKTSTGIDNTPNEKELENIEFLLKWLNENLSCLDYPVIVTSGFRSEAVNKKVGGVDNSHHRLGYAADLTCKDVEGLRDFLKKYLNEIDQLIYYKKKNFIHLSLHPNNRNQYFER